MVINGKEDIRKEHELNPIDVSYTTVGNKSTLFTDLLASNPFLKKSYEEQFIAGGSYSFTYNEQVIPVKKMQYFFHLTSEFAGNVFSLAKIIGGTKISSDNPSSIAGSIYSQFAKLSIDARGFYNFRDKNKLANPDFCRGSQAIWKFFNFGLTSNNFSAGGPNSIRAFRINSVGPGTYFQNTVNNGFLQLGG